MGHLIHGTGDYRKKGGSYTQTQVNGSKLKKVEKIIILEGKEKESYIK